MATETATRELVGEFPNVIIRASAGTGKTFALSNRYLRLLVSGAECQTILATTFTKKGAGEILDRIVSRLSDAALDPAAAEKLSVELDWKLTQSRAAEVLHDLLHNLHRLEISTLDSFFSRVAKVFSLELGLPPSWDIVDEQQMARLYDQAIQAVLHDERVPSLLNLLSKGEATRGIAAMIARTVDEVYRIYRESGPEPWDQIPLTGHFLADEQLDEIVAEIATLEFSKVSLTKHWVEVTKLAQSGDWAGFACTTSYQNMLAGGEKFGNTKMTPEMLSIYGRVLPHCRAVIETRLIQQNHSTRDLLMAFGALLDESKNASGDLRFDDVTERLQAFVGQGDTERLAFRLDHQIQHLLLDEFQDTSLVQWNVVHPFARSVTQVRESLRSFFCVGDMKQAIYGWRGGVAEIFDLVDDELPNLDATERLTTSFRSSQPVIDCVNKVFLNIGQFTCDDPVIENAIGDWVNWFSEHSTVRKELPGYVALEMAADCTEEDRDSEQSVNSIRNEYVLAKTVERVAQLLENMPADKTIGLIVRTNGEVGKLIFRLQQAGIPASEEGGNPITDSAAVELLLSALTLADHPGDSLARFHLSHSPLAETFGLQPETDANGRENETSAIGGAAAMRARLVEDGYGPTVETLARILMGHCTKRELLRLQQLVQVAYRSSGAGELWELRPKKFVDYIRDEVKIADQSSAQVRVMTIHKAKGLEFDAVVLPMPVTQSGLAGSPPPVVIGRDGPTSPITIASRFAGEKVRNLLPESFQKMIEEDRQRHVRESLCVMYVALTRAAHATYVIVSHGVKPNHKSAAGILLSTLCSDAELKEGLLFEHGDPAWQKSIEAPANKESDPLNLAEFYLADDAELDLTPISAELKSKRGVPRTSPSLLEGGNQVQLVSLFHSEKSDTARQRGELIHACFELVHWLDQAVPTKQQLHEHLKSVAPAVGNFVTITKSFYQLIEHETVQQLLSRDTYQELYLMHGPSSSSIMLEANRVEVETERPFAVQLEEGMLQGVIDRLVLIYEGDLLVAADVIDFKTDIVGLSGIAQRVAYYKPQLAAYRAAVAKFTQLPLEKISTRLLFVESGQLVNLDFVESQSDGTEQPARSSQQKKMVTSEPVKKKATRKSKRGQSGQQKLWDE